MSRDRVIRGRVTVSWPCVARRAAVVLSATVSAVLPARSLSAQAFEGVVTMRTSAAAPRGAPGAGAGQRAGQDIEYLVRNGAVRVNMSGAAGGMSMLITPPARTLFILMAAQRAYMEMPMGAMAAAPTAAPPTDITVTRTGRIETIAGYACEHVQMVSAAQTIDLCLAKGLGRYVNPMAAMAQGAVPSWQRMLMADDGFPLRITMADGSVPIEVVKIAPQRLDNALFAVPPTYTKMALPRRP